MSWPEVDFETLFAEPSRNGVYKSKDHHGSGVPIVNMGELFALNRIGNQPMSLIRMSDAEMEKSGLIDGDLLFGRRSLVEEGAGKCSMVYRPAGPLTFESSIIRVRLDRAIADPEFFFNYFRSPIGRSRIRAIVGGAAVKGIRGSDLKLIKVHVPPLDEQIAIRQVVALYDDLIATNQRRIALLEDAARRLYREWFVHLRFPGHESVPVKGGVPEGWRISTFGEQVSIRKGKNLTRSSVIPGEIPVVAAGLDPMAYHNAANAKGPVITISASGANAGYVRLYHEDIWASDCSYISNDVTDDLYFFYCALKERQTEILLMQKGAAQPHVYPKDIQAMDMIWPCHEVVALFQEHVASMFAFCGALLKQSDQLAQARDLLLPKLMSGQLDVSGIRQPEEAAA
jgi:type I restriction enzyme S subunit